MKTLSVMLLVATVLTVPVSLCGADENKDHICFRAMDADNDGKVTFQEFAKFYGDDRGKFNSADLNQDGRLTHDEYHDLLGHGSS
jgi:Ca2+-binding EF-hand superfamily protein